MQLSEKVHCSPTKVGLENPTESLTKGLKPSPLTFSVYGLIEEENHPYLITKFPLTKLQ